MKLWWSPITGQENAMYIEMSDVRAGLLAELDGIWDKAKQGIYCYVSVITRYYILDLDIFNDRIDFLGFVPNLSDTICCACSFDRCCGFLYRLYNIKI